MNNDTLASKYAEGAQDGTGSNMFINNDTIYSFGSHYKIAVRLDKDLSFATSYDHVFNAEGYSNATGGHKAHVRGYLSNYIEIPGCNIEENFLRNYIEELRLEVEEVKAKQAKLKTKGVRYKQFENKINTKLSRFQEVENFTIALHGGQAVHFIKTA